MRRKNPYSGLEKALGYRFRKKDLLETALTHPSYRFENESIEEDNQRLEFLGDAVLDFLTGAYLYDTLDAAREGVLTTLRSRVTSGKALARLARDIGLGAHLRVGRGEEASGGRGRSSNLADALEAVVGASYIDSGVKGPQKIFTNLFLGVIDELEADTWKENPKGKLQEVSQSRWKANPAYKVVGREGPAHAVRFTVEAVVSGRVLGRGTDSTKQKAEFRAAMQALRELGVSGA